jgi:hypothetical protein
MSNYHFKDKRLSLKAKGLLSQMLSLPDDWNYTMNGLVVINKENITAIKTALKELKSFGYLVITKKMPDETESGRIEYIYDIYELPKEKQPTENLRVENHTQLNINNKKINNKSIKNKLYNDEFEKLWEKYPRKQGKKQAQAAFEKAIREGVKLKDIKQGIERYLRYIEQNKIDSRYIKQGSTYFRNECWNDEIKIREQSSPSFDLDELEKIQ